MLKFLLLLVVVLVAGWMFSSRRRVRPPDDSKRQAPPPPPPAGPTAMLACAHCGVHVPQQEAVLDAEHRPFCSEAHRLAGPR